MTELNTHGKIKIVNVSRRGLLKGVAATGGLVLAAQITGIKGALADYPTGATAMPNGTVNNPKVFISIAPDGTVSIVAARAEMGNGAARTGLPMMAADELEADWAKVRVVQSPGDERTYGNQDTDGSRSVRHWIQPMRQCGAAARQMLEQAAAAQWKVDVAEVQAQLHEVVHKPTGRKLGYGELAGAAAALPVPAADKVKLKEPSAFRYIGKGTVRIADLVDITTGKATYGQDVMLPGMKFAVIARPPVVGGKVASVDTSEALKVPGVEKVVTLPPPPPVYKFAPLGGVAVIAKNTWAALKGREALKITWDDGPNKVYDSKTYRTQIEEAARKPGKVERNVGDVDKALASAAKVITGEYYSPHLHHATMEPPAAAARMNHGRWEVWAPVQSPGQARDEIANALGITSAEITLYPTLLGGGFGRKSKCDFATEAALLSKELGGAPSRWCGPARTTCATASIIPLRQSASRPGLDAKQQGGRVAAPQRRAVHPLHLRTRPEAPVLYRAGHGLGGYAVRCAQHPLGERRGPEPRAHRLVPLRQQRGTRLGDPVVRRRDGASAGPGPEGDAARADRPGAQGRPDQGGHDPLVELRRAARDLPGRYRPAAQRRRARRQGGGLGQDAAQGPGARHRRAPQLRHLYRHGRARGGGRQGPDHHPARRYGRGLRLLRASRARALADGRCGGDGA